MWIELASWISEICRENILYIIGYDTKKIKENVCKLLYNYFSCSFIKLRTSILFLGVFLSEILAILLQVLNILVLE